MKQLITSGDARGPTGRAWPAGSPLAAPDRLARAYASVGGDLAVVLDRDGTVLAAAQGEEPEGGWVQGWTGQRWPEVVAPDTRAKAARLLADALKGGEPRAREINLAAQAGRSMPFRCSALRLAEDGPVLIVGRDLGAQAALQQRLLALQQEMEGRYWRAAAGRARSKPALTPRRYRSNQSGEA